MLKAPKRTLSLPKGVPKLVEGLATAFVTPPLLLAGEGAGG